METQVTKENYREYLADIEAEFNLEEVTSVSARNGYPEGIIPLMVGLQSEEQANEILAKYPQAMFFEVEWKDFKLFNIVALTPKSGYIIVIF